MDGVFAMMVDITINSSNCVITWWVFSMMVGIIAVTVINGWRVFNDGRYNSQQQ